MTTAFRTYGEQSRHYFTRAHESTPDQPVVTAAAWRGDDFGPLEHVAYRLTPTDVDEIDQALAHTAGAGVPVTELTTADFALPTLAEPLTRWRRALDSGVGFQVVRGVPVDRWTIEESERFFWCLGLHLGVPGGQNPAGDLVGHVRDTGSSAVDPMVRLYETDENIRYHCDAADVVGLLCLSKAVSGGMSRFASSVTVFNETLARRPELATRLFEPFALDLRNESDTGGAGTVAITPCAFANGRLATFFHSDYFRSAARHDDVPALTPLEQEILDLYESIANEPGVFLEMDLEPGDIQLLSNHTNVHARTRYVDGDAATERRHLLRLWLSLS